MCQIYKYNQFILQQMRKQTTQLHSNGEQYYLPMINNRASQYKRQKGSMGNLQKKGFHHITRDIKNVERSIKKTVDSLSKLEASLSGQYIVKTKKSKTKFITQTGLQASALPQQKETLQDFYKRVEIERSYLRKLSNNECVGSTKQNIKVGDEIELQKKNGLFKNIRIYLDRRLQTKQKHIQGAYGGTSEQIKQSKIRILNTKYATQAKQENQAQTHIKKYNRWQGSHVIYGNNGNMVSKKKSF